MNPDGVIFIKLMFSKNVTKIDVDLTFATLRKMDGEGFVIIMAFSEYMNNHF